MWLIFVIGYLCVGQEQEHLHRLLILLICITACKAFIEGRITFPTQTNCLEFIWDWTEITSSKGLHLSLIAVFRSAQKNHTMKKNKLRFNKTKHTGLKPTDHLKQNPQHTFLKSESQSLSLTLNCPKQTKTLCCDKPDVWECWGSM